ncbi:MAG: hypothetical protein IT384_30215 [Deltaproteobacteria bacterium]|nr:hypothetical protein [Deltaproteobacteria bacterium]
MSVSFERRLLPSAGYRVLAAIDLGADAARLEGPRWFRPGWARALERLIVRATAEERLAIQLAPLAFESLEALSSDPRHRTSEVWGAFTDAVQRAARREERRTADRGAMLRLARARAVLVPLLERVRAALWPSGAPPLEVLDAPALGRHGRGWLRPSLHRVAVSLAEPTDHSLCLITHELIHGVTDRAVRAAHPHSTQDTRAHSRGAGLHAALERRALDHGDEIFARAIPELVSCYRAWRRGLA